MSQALQLYIYNLNEQNKPPKTVVRIRDAQKTHRIGLYPNLKNSDFL